MGSGLSIRRLRVPDPSASRQNRVRDSVNEVFVCAGLRGGLPICAETRLKTRLTLGSIDLAHREWPLASINRWMTRLGQMQSHGSLPFALAEVLLNGIQESDDPFDFDFAHVAMILCPIHRSGNRKGVPHGCNEEKMTMKNRGCLLRGGTHARSMVTHKGQGCDHNRRDDMSKPNFVLGLTGSVGSGCTTLSKGLEKHQGFKRVSISEAIKAKFRQLHGKEPTLSSYGEDWRAELQEIGNRGRKGEFIAGVPNGKDHRAYWVETVLQGVTEDRVVVDGIRNLGEVEYLEKGFTGFWLIAVCADYETRWNRINRETLYPSDRVFRRDDEADSGQGLRHGQQVQRCVYEADYFFRNVSPVEPAYDRESILAKKITEDIDIMCGKGIRSPYPDEVFMATAVSQSNASQCKKRKVGALIVDERSHVSLSVGYNGNPVGMESCFSLFSGKCYKDMVMESKLEKSAPFHCPKCGKRHEHVAPPWLCDGQRGDKVCGCNFKRMFFPSRNMEICTAIHAEERAIRSLGQQRAEGCTIYVNTFPCFQCSRYIADVGLSKVVYIEAYPTEEAVDFLTRNRVKMELFEGFMPRVFNRVFKQIE
jgi:deoxycytidylate deaminase/dephospho-CoA kinase